jgi:bifunctional ADP-heptose synthase (sugar kinase/adenylyltransferase)
LATVDAVAIFGERALLELIVAARPDVAVPGGEYEVEIRWSAVVRPFSWDGQVTIVRLFEGISTTRLIEKVTGNQPDDAIGRSLDDK